MKALFLDIDGVIQAHGDQDRFEHINVAQAMDILINQDGSYSLPDVVKTDELEQ